MSYQSPSSKKGSSRASSAGSVPAATAAWSSAACTRKEGLPLRLRLRMLKARQTGTARPEKSPRRRSASAVERALLAQGQLHPTFARCQRETATERAEVSAFGRTRAPLFACVLRVRGALGSYDV